jgi:hypothetical protein
MNLFELKEQLRNDGVLITFSGSFSQGVVEELGTAVRKYLESFDSKKPPMMDVFSVYIEAAQNVRNYSERRLASGGSAADLDANIVVISRRTEQYIVYAGNQIDAMDVTELAATLDRLAKMDKAELRALYKEQMRKERPASGGAGLGLIEMARRASEPLQYSFTPTVDGKSFFSLCVVI